MARWNFGKRKDHLISLPFLFPSRFLPFQAGFIFVPIFLKTYIYIYIVLYCVCIFSYIFHIYILYIFSYILFVTIFLFPPWFLPFPIPAWFMFVAIFTFRPKFILKRGWKFAVNNNQEPGSWSFLFSVPRESSLQIGYTCFFKHQLKELYKNRPILSGKNAPWNQPFR